MTKIEVQLPETAASFIEEQVVSGTYASAGDFLLSVVEDAHRKSAIDRVDQLLLEGVASGPGEESSSEWWAKTRAEWRESRNGGGQFSCCKL